MPFITEELWHGLFNGDRTASISLTSSPTTDASRINESVEQRFEILQSVVEGMRRQRAEMGIPPGERLDVHLSVPESMVAFFNELAPAISALGRCGDLNIGTGVSKPEGSVADVVRGVEIFLIVAGKVDLEKERVRLTKERERLMAAIAGVEKKLANAAFVENAKPEVVEAERQKHKDWSDAVLKIERNLGSL
jgi:valyl-tRNA synthetase